MKRQIDEAFVLQTQVLGEADLIVSLFTAGHGRVRGVARSARKSRRRFGGWLEPLSHVRATWVEREGRELQRIESLEGLRSFAALQSEPVGQATCAVLAEVAGLFTHEGQAEPATFKLLGSVLIALDEGKPAPTMLRYFEYWILRLHGLLPDVTVCASCGGALDRSGGRLARGRGPVCSHCEDQEAAREGRLGRSDREFLAQARRLPPAEIPDGPGAARSGGLVERLLRGVIEAYAERPVRSYRHLSRALALAEPSGETR